MGMPVHPDFDQDGWRTRTNVTNPTGINAAYDGGDDAANTDWTQDTGALFRPRFVIKQEQPALRNSSDSDTEFLLQYNNGGAGWNDVGAIGGGSADVDFADGDFTDGDNTTQLVGGGTFVTGDGLEITPTDTLTFTDLQATETEIEAALIINAAQVTDGDTIDLRLLYSAGNESPPATVFTQYTNIPTITVNKPAVAPSFAQDGWRARTAVTDPADVNAAYDASDAAEDADWEQNVGELFRPRLIVNQTDVTANNHANMATEFVLQYRNNSEGTWKNVGAVGGGAEDVDFANAAFTDGANTTQLLNGAGAFVTGDGVENDTRSDTVTFTDEALTTTELEYGLIINEDQVSDGDTIDLRLLYSAGNENPPATTMTYTAIPTITVNIPDPPEPPAEEEKSTFDPVDDTPVRSGPGGPETSDYLALINNQRLGI